MRHIHCLDPFLETTDIDIVFVGTITSSDGLKNGFYYTSCHNSFYRLLSEVYKESKVADNYEKLLKKSQATEKEKTDAIKELKSFLREKQIGIFDMVLEADAPDKSDRDEYLQNEKIRDARQIEEWIKKHHIKKLVCTSKSGEKSALGYLKQSYEASGLVLKDDVYLEIITPANGCGIKKEDRINNWKKTLEPYIN